MTRTRRTRIFALINKLKVKREALVILGKKIQTILNETDDKSLNVAERIQARDVAKSLLELASALAYTPCPACQSPCPDWIVKQKPCGAYHEKEDQEEGW